MSNTLTSWSRRYTFNEWKQFSRNKHLSLKEAQELYRRESLQYLLYEQELLRLTSERNVAIVNSFTSVQSAIFNVLSGYQTALNSVSVAGGGYAGTPFQAASIGPRAFPDEELVTEQTNDQGEPFLLMTETFENLLTEGN